LYNKMEDFNQQHSQPDVVLAVIEANAKLYIDKCKTEWSKNAIKYLKDKESFIHILPDNPKTAPQPIMEGLANKYPFIDWLVIASCHGQPDADGDKVAYSKYRADARNLTINFFSYSLFESKYPSYFKDEDTHLNLVVWGYVRNNNAPLKQLTASMLSYTMEYGYLDHGRPMDKAQSAQSQWNDMVVYAKNNDRHYIDSLYLVHLDWVSKQGDFFIRIATNNPQMYISTMHTVSDEEVRELHMDKSYLGRQDIDFVVASHQSAFSTLYIDPFVLVSRTAIDGNHIFV
ncbi:MAG: hypothetical protein AAGD05_13375, partial [Bacteroidota bacterium]